MKVPARRILDDVLVADQRCLGAVFCSYTFDPIYFEDHVLRAVLRLSGDPDEDAGRYHEEARAALRESPVACFVDASVRTPGRRLPYDLHLVRTRTFHPKVYLVLYEREARLAIGSGNLTRAGLERNTELFFHRGLRYDVPSDAALLRSVDAFFTACAALCVGECRELAQVLAVLRAYVATTPTTDGPPEVTFVETFTHSGLAWLDKAIPADATIDRVGVLAPFFERDDLAVADDQTGLASVLTELVRLRPRSRPSLELGVPWEDTPLARPAAGPTPTLAAGPALWALRGTEDVRRRGDRGSRVRDRRQRRAQAGRVAWQPRTQEARPRGPRSTHRRGAHVARTTPDGACPGRNPATARRRAAGLAMAAPHRLTRHRRASRDPSAACQGVPGNRHPPRRDLDLRDDRFCQRQPCRARRSRSRRGQRRGRCRLASRRRCRAVRPASGACASTARRGGARSSASSPDQLGSISRPGSPKSCTTPMLRTLTVTWATDGPAPLATWALRYVERVVAAGRMAQCARARTHIDEFDLAASSAELAFDARRPRRGRSRSESPTWRCCRFAPASRISSLRALARAARAASRWRATRDRARSARSRPASLRCSTRCSARRFGPTDIFKAWWGLARRSDQRCHGRRVPQPPARNHRRHGGVATTE
jgi:hypothetical protein